MAALHYRQTLLATALSLSMGFATNTLAQDTSSSLRGIVQQPDGSPATNTQIVVTHLPSGSTKTIVTNTSGVFQAKGLRVGGPYRILVDSNIYPDQELKNVFLELGATENVEVILKEGNLEEVVVTASQLANNFSKTGPSTSFDIIDLENAPTVNRDIKDLVRVDPRIYVDESSSGAIQCAGSNPRFNSLTVDGVRMNDNFGLNSNGYPTERIPFSFDAIDQVAVELAPFGVQYGGFTACNINAVTKSGGNELHGGVFFDYTSDSLKGDSLEGDNIPTGSFDEKRIGFNVGGALVEDTLFFFAAYEKLEGSELFQYTPFDNGRISQAEIDEIIDISKTLYNYDPGSMVPSMPVEDEKLLVKLDWNINQDHRASFTYNYNDGFTLQQSDESSSRLSLSNHFYERGGEFTSYVGSLYSDWSENFSTEVRIGYSELVSRQISLDASSSFAEVQVRNVGSGVRVYLGPDDSRQSNELDYENLSFKFAGTYYLEEHKITFGYEFEDLDVFNLFVQHSQGENRFESIDDFRSGIAKVYYGNTNSHNPSEAAGEFSYRLNTVYLQDEYTFLENDLTIEFGARYDWYTSDDLPNNNPNFSGRYGFSNQQNLDGKDLFQPRFGFNWGATDNIEVRGGFGLYSGGNPNVWISNSYSNDGIRNIQFSEKNVQLLGPDAVALVNDGRPIYDVPQSLYDKVGAGSVDSSTNVTDPGFKIPSEWKYALGLVLTTDSDYTFTIDYLYSERKNAAVLKNLADSQVGTAPDGRPVYDSVNHFRNTDFLLTNVKGDSGYSSTFSVGVQKTFDFGLDMTFAYSRSVAKDIHPMASSVAFSNYHGVATSDPGNIALAHSNYEIPHRFTLNLSYSTELIAGLETRVSLFGQANQGRPYDYNFTGSSDGLGFNENDRQLLYVPLVDDPLVSYGADFDLAAFNQLIESEGLTRGEIMERNSLESTWWTKFDLKLEQQVPGFVDDHKGSVFIVVNNLGNLLNDEWGILRQGDTMSGAVKVNAEGEQFVYETFEEPSAQSRDTDTSLWEVRLGVKYTF